MYTRPLVIMGLFYVQKIPYYYGTFLCTVVPYYYGTFLCTVQFSTPKKTHLKQYITILCTLILKESRPMLHPLYIKRTHNRINKITLSMGQFYVQ